MNEITISNKRYKELLAAEAHLNHLHAQGVDNWEWYSHPDEKCDICGKKEEYE